jgi:ribosomal peptide maturation radical SAM protein 1
MDVFFVVMPFADVDRPAIGVSLLKAELQRRGFSSRIEYLNIALAETIGKELYMTISDSLPSEALAGEWFFADRVFADIPHEDDYVRQILTRFADDGLVAKLREARAAREAFVRSAVEVISAQHARIVGFTTTFHQTCASLAVARRLKELPDPPIVVFGGANCEGEMGLQLIKAFPWIDYVCTREGDHVFPEFVHRFLRNGDPSAMTGLLRRGESSVWTVPEVVSDLDSLPMPDYDEYFERVHRSPIAAEIKPELLVETSRGCWWGAKHHCTFCGLNGDTMVFRSKSADRVVDEMAALSRAYSTTRVNCVDNILDLKYVGSVFPRLAQLGLDLELFYEVKSNLRYDQLRMLHAGGVRTIQPGIESFSDEVLKLMKKGTTGAQNLQLLRWCEEIGVLPAWNILAGFPGESVAEYRQMEALVPLLVHLQAPTSCFQIRLDRFSPFFVNPQAYGMTRVRPTIAYYYVFPLGRRELARLAYFFDFDYEDGRKPDDYLGALKAEVSHWWRQRLLEDTAARPRLDARWTAPDEATIEDTRPCAARAVHRLSGLEARLYLAADTAGTVDGFARRLNAEADQVGATLERFVADKLAARMDGRYLSLAVFRNRPTLDIPDEEPVYAPATLSAAPPAKSLLRLL